MISDAFNKKIQDLENKIYKNELDISKLFLSSEEIVRNIIRFKNPSMSIDDVNLMVYGENYKPPIDTDVVTTLKENIVKNRYSFEVLNNTDTWSARVTYENRVIGITTFPINYTVTINNAEYSGEEAVRKFLENESKVNGFTFDGVIYPKTEEKNIETLSNTIPKLDTSISNSLRDYSPYPIPKGSQYYIEAGKVKDEVRKAALLLNLNKKELLNQLISSLTLLNSSIPGITMMVSTPPWNIPAALSMTALVLDSLNDLISKSIKVIDNLSPLKNLQLLLSAKNLNEVVRILNPLITVLMVILDPIEKIKKFILKIIEKIKSLFNSNNCRKQIRRIKRQITKKNVELSKKKVEIVSVRVSKNTSKANELQEDIDDLTDEISDLKTQLGELQKRCGKKISLEQDFEELNNLVTEVNSESDTWIESLTFDTVYDVVLPDGTTLNGLTEEQLNNLKQDYTIVFNN